MENPACPRVLLYHGFGIRGYDYLVTRLEHFIEDPTPGSGHMQIQNPSSVTGLFEPAVKLGTEVRSGERLGLVYDIEDCQPREILAGQNGLVLVLRTFPPVEKGESVGVVAAPG